MDPDSKATPSRRRRNGAAPLRVSVTDARGRAVRGGGLARWLARLAPKSARGDVAIAIVSDARMRILNRSYRSTDHATDVLSFAASDPQLLGDVVIARGVATRQARDAGHSFNTELRVLALHGLLHLLGYDHETDAGRMARVESRLRRKGGLSAGLIGRVPRR